MKTDDFNFAVHPGRIMNEYLKALKMSQKKLSQLTGINKTVINELIKGKRKFTESIAIKLEPIFNMPAIYWCNLQDKYDKKTEEDARWYQI